MSKISVILGDITKQNCDAIVNAANTSLLGGGGVDGAIHKAAGSELLDECRALNGCKTGEAKITKSYNLSSNGVKWIIHAVGPIWRGGNFNESVKLKNAYENSLKLCANYKEEYVNQCINLVKNKLHRFNGCHNLSLENCEKKALNLIEKKPLKTVAFPSISTGAYNYPLKEAASIAIDTIKSFLEKNNSLDEVIIVCYDEKTFNVYNSLVDND